MKEIILAGGLGTRLAEETGTRPKPMVEIGDRPVLWHIMKIYSPHAINDFIICLGYKGYVIKEYFANYYLHNSDITFDMRDNSMKVHQASTEPWSVTLIHAGAETMIGGRIKRILRHVIVERMACEISRRVSHECCVTLLKQTEFPEPMMRVNTDSAMRYVPAWSESAAWDSYAESFVSKLT